MSTKTIHLKFRLMDELIWNFPQKHKFNQLLPRKFAKTLNLDRADINWHTNASKKNSPELLWLLSLYSSELYLRNVSRTEVKIFINMGNMQNYFREIYYYTRNLWLKEYPVNILFTGSDIIFRDYVNLESFSGFQMFNYASLQKDFVSRTGNRDKILSGEEYFKNYLNCDVRYFSHDMDESLWDVGNSWADNWVPDIWEYEQDLYNAMLRNQDDKITKILPQLAYQAPVNKFYNLEFLNKWNGIEIKNSQIIHLHSTRSPDKALEIARDLVFKFK
jgi:hypothetical protein